MKKNSEIRIKCTTEEREKIKRESEKVGMSIQEYSLMLLLNTEVSITLKSRGN